MNLQDLTTKELIEAYSQIISILKDRKVIRTKNIVGELGENIVIEYYNKTTGRPKLTLNKPGTPNVDAIDKAGKQYSIKAISNKTTGVFHGLKSTKIKKARENRQFDFLIIACLDNTFNLKMILQLTWEQFIEYKGWHKTMNAWNISITKELIKEGEVIFEC